MCALLLACCSGWALISTQLQTVLECSPIAMKQCVAYGVHAGGATDPGIGIDIAGAAAGTLWSLLISVGPACLPDRYADAAVAACLKLLVLPQVASDPQVGNGDGALSRALDTAAAQAAAALWVVMSHPACAAWATRIAAGAPVARVLIATCRRGRRAGTRARFSPSRLLGAAVLGQMAVQGLLHARQVAQVVGVASGVVAGLVDLATLSVMQSGPHGRQLKPQGEPPSGRGCASTARVLGVAQMACQIDRHHSCANCVVGAQQPTELSMPCPTTPHHSPPASGHVHAPRTSNTCHIPRAASERRGGCGTSRSAAEIQDAARAAALLTAGIGPDLAPTLGLQAAGALSHLVVQPGGADALLSAPGSLPVLATLLQGGPGLFGGGPGGGGPGAERAMGTPGPGPRGAAAGGNGNGGGLGSGGGAELLAAVMVVSGLMGVGGSDTGPERQRARAAVRGHAPLLSALLNTLESDDPAVLAYTAVAVANLASDEDGAAAVCQPAVTSRLSALLMLPLTTQLPPPQPLSPSDSFLFADPGLGPPVTLASPPFKSTALGAAGAAANALPHRASPLPPVGRLGRGRMHETPDLRAPSALSTSQEFVQIPGGLPGPGSGGGVTAGAASHQADTDGVLGGPHAMLPRSRLPSLQPLQRGASQAGSPPGRTLQSSYSEAQSSPAAQSVLSATIAAASAAAGAWGAALQRLQCFVWSAATGVECFRVPHLRSTAHPQAQVLCRTWRHAVPHPAVCSRVKTYWKVWLVCCMVHRPFTAALLSQVCYSMLQYATPGPTPFSSQLHHVPIPALPHIT